MLRIEGSYCTPKHGKMGSFGSARRKWEILNRPFCPTEPRLLFLKQKRNCLPASSSWQPLLFPLFLEVRFSLGNWERRNLVAAYSVWGLPGRLLAKLCFWDGTEAKRRRNCLWLLIFFSVCGGWRFSPLNQRRLYKKHKTKRRYGTLRSSIF